MITQSKVQNSDLESIKKVISEVKHLEKIGAVIVLQKKICQTPIKYINFFRGTVIASYSNFFQIKNFYGIVLSINYADLINEIYKIRK